MAQAQGAFGRLILVEENAFKTAPELVVENCEDAWNEYVDGDVTAELDAVDFKVGAGSCKLTMAAGVGVEILASEVISTPSLANYTHISAWVKSSVALAAGDLQLLLDEHALCVSPLETLNIPALVANTWTQIRLTLANPATDLLLISIGLKQAVDKGAFVFRIDDIRAIKGGVYLPFKNESLRMSRNLKTSDIIRSTRNPNKPTLGRREVAGDIATELNAYMGLLFKHLLGSYVRTGVGPYTHTFKIGNLPIGLQVEKQFSDIEKYLVYNGCKINSLSVSLADEGAPELKVSVMGAKETNMTLPFDGAPTDFGHNPFDAFEATINRGGSGLGIGTKVDFTVDNGLDGSVFVIDGTGERYSLPAGIVKVTGTLTALFEDMTLYNLALNNEETSLQVILQKGTGDGSAGNEKLTFNFDEIIFKPQAPVITGPAGVLVELPLEAYYDNDSDASALWIELMNAQALLC